MSMKNSNDTNWDRTSNLPICSTAPQPLCYRGPHIYRLREKKKNKKKKMKKKKKNHFILLSGECYLGRVTRNTWKTLLGIAVHYVCMEDTAREGIVIFKTLHREVY